MVISEFTNGQIFSLKDACLHSINKIVQKGVGAREQHDCEEDTLATREVILFFCGKEKDELKEWGKKALLARNRQS